MRIYLFYVTDTGLPVRKVFQACNLDDYGELQVDQTYHFISDNATACSCLIRLAVGHTLRHYEKSCFKVKLIEHIMITNVRASNVMMGVYLTSGYSQPFLNIYFVHIITLKYINTLKYQNRTRKSKHLFYLSLWSMVASKITT